LLRPNKHQVSRAARNNKVTDAAGPQGGCITPTFNSTWGHRWMHQGPADNTDMFLAKNKLGFQLTIQAVNVAKTNSPQVSGTHTHAGDEIPVCNCARCDFLHACEDWKHDASAHIPTNTGCPRNYLQVAAFPAANHSKQLCRHRGPTPPRCKTHALAKPMQAKCQNPTTQKHLPDWQNLHILLLLVHPGPANSSSSCHRPLPSQHSPQRHF
jgi:hypothetical protein